MDKYKCLEIINSIEESYHNIFDLIKKKLSSLEVYDIEPVGFLILWRLKGKEMRAQDIINNKYYMGRNPTYQFKLLEKRGYITRTSNKGDLRSNIIKNTLKANTLCEKFYKVFKVEEIESITSLKNVLNHI